MKFFYLCLFLFPFFISCSDTTDLHNSTHTIKSDLYSKAIDATASYKANPYDAVGELQNEILEAYYSNDALPTSYEAISSKVVAIAQNDLNFTALGSDYIYSSNSIERVLYLLNHASTCQQEVLNARLDSARARSGLNTFIESLLSLCATENDYAIIYSFITDYEDSVLADSYYSIKDKKVILITTSVARHSAYMRKKKPKKNKDPEWDYMVTNIVAATDGATDSIQESVMRAVVSGIVENPRLN